MGAVIIKGLVSDTKWRRGILQRPDHRRVPIDLYRCGVQCSGGGVIGLDAGRVRGPSVGMELSADTRDNEGPASTTRSGAARCPASRRLLSYGSDSYGAGQQPQVVSFAPGCGASGPRPSRRREEAKALQNLQRRVEACRLTKGVTPGDPGGASSSTAVAPPASHQLLDNRPQLLQKVGRAEEVPLLMRTFQTASGCTMNDRCRYSNILIFD
jgi:hypothetical protein